MSILKTILVSMFVIFSLISTGCFSTHNHYYNEHENDEDDPNYAVDDDSSSEDSSDSGGESDIVILGMIAAGFVVVGKNFVWRMA